MLIYCRNCDKSQCDECDKCDKRKIYETLKEIKHGDQTVMDENIENLCQAIISQAAKDYRDALKKGDEKEIQEVERFFNSSWYKQMTNVDGDYILKKIKSEYE